MIDITIKIQVAEPKLISSVLSIVGNVTKAIVDSEAPKNQLKTAHLEVFCGSVDIQIQN